MDSLLRDLRYGFRLLLKNPGTTLSAVLTLALGIGATSAIFTFVNAALLRGLPFPRPEQLLDITMTQKGSNFASTYLNFLDWQQQAKSFCAMGAYNRGPAILYSGNTPERVVTLNVSGGFFSTLQVRAAEGRLLQDSDQLTSPPAVAVVTHAFGELHRNIASVGDSLKIGNTSYQIVGVLPREFQFPSAGQIDVIIPLNPKAVNFSRRDFHNVNVVARLRSGVVMDQAQSEMSTIAARQAQQYPDTNAGLGVRLQSLHQSVVGSTQQLLLLLLGAVSLVLLIACANVANVMLA